MTQKLRCVQIIQLLNRLAPLDLAEDWDTNGLQLGSPTSVVSRIGVALEVTSEVVDWTEENRLDLLVVHHPLVFQPLTAITDETFEGRLIIELSKSNANVYVIHTPLDRAPNGMAYWLAEALGAKPGPPLRAHHEELYKFVVFAPIGSEAQLIEAVGKAGAGHIGNYSHCTFRVEGRGTFRPGQGTNPYIGTEGRLEVVDEVRLETIVPKSKLAQLLEEVKKVHPYEEPAWDVYPTRLVAPKGGLGCVARLPRADSVGNIAAMVKERLGVPVVKLYGNSDLEVQTVGLCPGSGADLWRACLDHDCPVLITGDVKHHTAAVANQAGVVLIDAGHAATESVFIKQVGRYLQRQLESADVAVLQFEYAPGWQAI